MIKNKLQKGQAALLIIFVLGMTSVLIGISLVKTGYAESVMGRTTAASTQAFYIANSGVEDAMYKIQVADTFGNPGPDTFVLDIGGGSAQVTVSGSDDIRIVESTGSFDKYIRKIRVEVQNTSTKPGFASAIHAGLGGVELRNQTLVTSLDGSGGNVFSNSFVKAAKNDYTAATGDCKNAASAVDGSVWAVGKVDKLATNDSGPCVLKNAYANNLDYCWVKGDVYSPVEPPASCPFGGSWTDEPAPEPRELPQLGVDILKNYLNSKGNVFNGNCVADGSGGANDCTNGTNRLGNIIVTGTLSKPSNVNLFIDGPVWVKGDVTFDSLGSLRPAPEITTISQIFVTDGRLISSSNISYGANVDAYLLFLSTYDPGVDEADVCTDPSLPAITISSNSNSVLFYALNGCVKVNANSDFYGAILGTGIRIDNNSDVNYDPNLQYAIFGLTNTGGWQVLSFKEL